MQQGTIAFVGLGTMGAGMVANLLAAGHRVAGYNRSAGRVAPLVEQGMVAAESPAAATEGARVVFTCVSDDDALRNVVSDPHRGVLTKLAAGATFVDCGTSSLELTAELAAAVAEREANYLDAPMTGSKLGAEGGKLTFMVGGEQSVLEGVEPLLSVMGKHIVHVGENVGAGQAAKYCLNMTQAVVLQGILEGYTLAKKSGVDLERMAEVFENSAGRTGVGSFKTPYLFRGEYSPHFKLALMHKDLHLALRLAGEKRVPLPAARTVCTLYDQGVAEGLGDQDFLVLAKLMERWARTTLRPGG